jgi:hypothetical protein
MSSTYIVQEKGSFPSLAKMRASRADKTDSHVFCRERSCRSAANLFLEEPWGRMVRAVVLAAGLLVAIATVAVRLESVSLYFCIFTECIDLCRSVFLSTLCSLVCKCLMLAMVTQVYVKLSNRLRVLLPLVVLLKCPYVKFFLRYFFSFEARSNWSPQPKNRMLSQHQPSAHLRSS